MRHRLVGTVLALAAVAATAPPAAAAPRGQGLEPLVATCPALGGEVSLTTGRGSGSAVWLGDQMFVLASYTFVGDGVTASQTLGRKRGLGARITCTLSVDGGVTTLELARVRPRR